MLSVEETKKRLEKLRQLISIWSERILPDVLKYAEMSGISIPAKASPVNTFRKIAQHLESAPAITVFAFASKRIVSRRYLEKIPNLQAIELYSCLEDFLLLLEVQGNQNLRQELSKEICPLFVLPPPHPRLPLISPISNLYLASLVFDSQLIANYLFAHLSAYSSQLRANPNDSSLQGPIWQICTLIICHPALPVEVRIEGYHSRVSFPFANPIKSMDDKETLHLLLHQYKHRMDPTTLAAMKSFLKQWEATDLPGTPADAQVPRGYISFSLKKFYDEAIRKFLTEFVKRDGSFLSKDHEDQKQALDDAILASAEESAAVSEEERIAAQRIVGVWYAFGTNGVDLDPSRAREHLESTSPGDARCILEFASKLLAFEAQNNFDRNRKDLTARLERYLTSCRDKTVHSGPMCSSKGCHEPNAKFRCPCNRVHYCSKKCQQDHWPEHKPNCDAKKKAVPK